MRRAAIIVLLFSLPAIAQTIELQGGQSTLLGASGGGAEIYLPNSDVKLGAGVVDGRFAVGASDTFSFRGATITAGDSAFSYSAGGVGGLGIAVRGLTITRQSPDNSVSAFAGATGLGFDMPFFSATTATHAGAGLYWSHLARHKVHFAALAAFAGNQKTAAVSADGRWRQFHFAGAGGILAGQRTFTGDLEYRPSRAFNAGFARQELFWQGQRATVNSLSAFSNLGPFSLHGSAIDSQSNRNVLAVSAGAGVRAGFASFGADFYQSNGQRLWTQSVQQNFRHWNLSESISESGPQHSFGFGAGYHGNRGSISVGQAIEFLPFAGGFNQVLQIAVSIKIPHSDSNVSAQISWLPTGANYTVNGSSFVNGPIKFEGQSGPRQHITHKNAGRFEIHGVVLSKSGMPVVGAAIDLGGQTVYTDHTGHFNARFRKAKPVPVQVRPQDFAAPGRWVVLSAPTTAQPGAGTVQIEVTTN
jgi:hypothetical protein